MGQNLCRSGSGEFIPILLMARSLDYGGVERDVEKYSLELRRRGFLLRVACFRPGGVRWRELESAGIPVLAVPVTSFRKFSLIRAFASFRDYLSTNRIQILHAFDSATSLFAIPAAKSVGIPVAISSQLRFRSLVPKRIRYLLPLIDWMSTGVFANCFAVGDDLRRAWSVPQRKLHVCYNGFRSEEFHPNGKRKPADLEDARVVVGTVAVLRPEKNIECLIRAFARVVPFHKGLLLVVVGDGPMRSELVECARGLGLSNNVLFTGARSDPAVWMRAIDIFVNCSTSESFSNSLLEAMACGCCPVASHVGGSPEMLTDGRGFVCGLLVKSNDIDDLARAIGELCTDGAKRQSFAAAATKLAFEKFSIQASANRLASLYYDLLAKSRGAAEE